MRNHMVGRTEDKAKALHVFVTGTVATYLVRNACTLYIMLKEQWYIPSHYSLSITVERGRSARLSSRASFS